jgi:metal-dependent amidase/aminoacylase/carboxypeptidase family protein
MYEDVLPNTTLAEVTKSNAHAISMKVDPVPPGRSGSGASTDFGNVSQIMPSFAMKFAIAEEPVPGHSRLLTEAAKSHFAQESAINTAKALAITACDLLTNPDLVLAARAEFAERGN